MKILTIVFPTVRGLLRLLVPFVALFVVTVVFQKKVQATEIFAENFDGAAGFPAGWAVNSNGNGTGWSLSSGTVDTPSYAMAVPESVNSVDAWLTSPSILIPTPGCKLSFRHRYNMTHTYNRGWLEISISGGSFNDFLSAGGFFLANGYSGSYAEGWKGTTNSFITTEAYFPPAAAGQTVQLRWRFYAEYSGSGAGWLVDTISISDGITSTPDDISVSLSGLPNPIAIGANLIYSIRLSNSGPSTATALLLTNILPAGVTFVSATPSAGTCSNIGGTIVCGFGNLAGQTAATLTVVVQPTANGLLTNRVSVTRGEPDVYLLNNTSAITTTVTPPALYASNVSIAEDDSVDSNVGIAVTLQPASPQTVTVNYSTTNRSAIAGKDYSSSSGTLTFSPGETSKIVIVPVLGDELDETNETFSLHLSDAANAGLAAADAVVTILDNDDPPYLIVLDAIVVEGNSGTTYALFRTLLNEPSGLTVSASFYTYNGSAVPLQDFSVTNGTVIFSPGTTEQFIVVRVVGDTSPEENEYFSLELRDLVNASRFSYSAYGWILNDDGLPGQLHHFAWHVSEVATFVGQPLPVTLVAQDYFNSTVTDFTNIVSFTASAAGGNATNTLLNAASPNDSYTYPQTAGFAFMPNTNLVVTHVRHYSGVRVSLWTDAVTLVFSQPVTGAQGTWTETELMSPVQLAAGVRYRLAVFRGNQSVYHRSSVPPQFNHGTIEQGYWSYDDGFPQNTSSALWLVDLRYAAGSLQDVTISPTSSGNFVGGVWSGNIMPLVNASGVRLQADDGQGHTGRSDPFDVLVMDDVRVSLAASADPVGVGANLTYFISLTNGGPSTATGLMLTNFLPVGVTFVSATASQGSCTNFAGIVVCDLGALPAASSATATVNVLVGGIGSLTNLATITRAEPDFTLANNFATVVTTVMTPMLTVENAAVAEGNTGVAPLVFNVRLSPVSGQSVSVNFATAGGSAIAGNDFTNVTGTLLFGPGQTNQSVTAFVTGDFLNEADETILLTLAEPINATLGLTQSVGYIVNDDPLPALLIYDTIVREGNIGTTNAVFRVSLTATSSHTVSVSYDLYGGTAQSPGDYVATSGTLLFLPGSTTGTITVPVKGDTIVENTETFVAHFYSPQHAMLANFQATGFIENDDGLLGQLHHFSWTGINSPPSPGQPLTATITARDYFSNQVSSFSGSVSLSAYRVSAETSGTILEAPTHSANDQYGSYTFGYSFTPNVDLLVTHVRHYFGSKVSIWTDDGNLLASQSVNSLPGTWKETALSSPVWLFAGIRYRVGVYSPSGSRYLRYDGPSAFNHGTINQGHYTYQDDFPQDYDSARWWFVDLRYVVQTRQPLAVSPTVTPNFVGGQWVGNISVLDSGGAITLRADDNLGHFGLSNPFDLTGVRLGITPLGGTVLLNWPTNAPEFLLESADDLNAPINWKPITNTPAIVGDQNVVTNPAVAERELFRLRKP